MSEVDWAEALRRINVERAERSGKLDLARLDIERLPSELADLSWLNHLDCRGTQVQSLEGLWCCPGLLVFDCSFTPIISLEGVGYCAGLTILHCAGSEITSLRGLASCAELAELDCSDCEELESLQGLGECANLVEINFIGCSRLTSLVELENCPALNILSCSGSAVSSLKGLESCRNLSALHVSSCGELTSLEELRECANLLLVDCSSTPITSLDGLGLCPRLTTLDCEGTDIRNLNGVGSCPSLSELNCSGCNQLTSLDDLRHCLKLAELNCSDCKRLTSFRGLQTCSLITLNCSGCPRLKSLEGLESCPKLETLDCSDCSRLKNLGGLGCCPVLSDLNCSDCQQISNLSGPSSLPTLSELDCSSTAIEDLRTLLYSPNIIKLYCSGCINMTSLKGVENAPALSMIFCVASNIEDIAPLGGCKNIKEVYCGNTRVRDLYGLDICVQLTLLDCSACAELATLEGLEGCDSLVELDCSFTKISNLETLRSAPKLSRLRCSNCTLNNDEEALWNGPLEEVIFAPGALAGVPQELLSQTGSDNCLPRLRDYFRARATGVIAVRTAKLFVLGNGSVGKTQLGRRLRGEIYDPKIPTTHGVDIHRFCIPTNDGRDVTINHWDFGGQPLYHGAHALFLRRRAVYLLVWSPGSEGGEHTDSLGQTHRNHPLPYWLAYARAAGGDDSAALVVQTKCDPGGHPQAEPPIQAGALGAFACSAPWQAVSAIGDGYGLASLKAELAQAATRLLSRHGLSEISVRWAAVIDQIAEMRPTDSPVQAGRKSAPLAPGKVRTLAREAFGDLCRSCGLEVGHETLLHYLNATGEVFHRPGLFQDQVIIDQNWALEAIYAVFERETCRQRLVAQQGRFTAKDLADWLWDTQGFSPEEQALFLSFMRSSGICFNHYSLAGETNYIAPSALPELGRLRVDHDDAWQKEDPTEIIAYQFDFLHDGILQALLSRLGEHLRLRAEYWRDGVLIPDERGVRARVRLVRRKGHAASILVEAQAPKPRSVRAGALAAVLCRHVEYIVQQAGLRGVRSSAAGRLHGADHHRVRRGRPVDAGTGAVAALEDDLKPDPASTQPSGHNESARVNALDRRLRDLPWARLRVLILSLPIPTDQRPPHDWTPERQRVAALEWVVDNGHLDTLEAALSADEPLA